MFVFIRDVTVKPLLGCQFVIVKHDFAKSNCLIRPNADPRRSSMLLIINEQTTMMCSPAKGKQLI